MRFCRGRIFGIVSFLYVFVIKGVGGSNEGAGRGPVNKEESSS